MTESEKMGYSSGIAINGNTLSALYGMGDFAYVFEPPASEWTLSISKAGQGSGLVTSAPAGIDCGPSCTESFADSTPVILSAIPDAGYVVAGWSGDEDCQDGTVIMSSDVSCTANFNRQIVSNYSSILLLAP
jgi:hypothetical protein